MDLLAWTVQAINMLLDKTVNDSLKAYQVVEIALETRLFRRYQAQKTGSTAILTAIEALKKNLDPVMK